MIPFFKFILLFFFLPCNRIQFALCYTSISIKTPGVHNFQVSSDSMVEIMVPEFYQAFIFSNVDMGPYNAFYLDNSVVPTHYRNLYGIAFNGSSCIFIRYASSKIQNMAVFIIPYENCNQHSFYAMSKNIFRAKITTKKFNHSINICGFSPSFLTDVNRIVTFGHEVEIDAGAQIFYGFNQELSNQHSFSYKKSNRVTKSIDNIIEELNDFIKIKAEYRKFYNQIYNSNIFKYNLFNFFRLNKHSNIKANECIDNRLQKDTNEEEYFNMYYKKRFLFPTVSQNPTQSNMLSSIHSPGFLFSFSISSEIRKTNVVNSTYYIVYGINQHNVEAKLIFDREYDIQKRNQQVDTTMLTSHCDYLLYYDKHTSTFIYDNNWANKFVVSYKGDMWQLMKWVWIILIIIFIVITLLIIGCICGCIRSDRICCFKRKNTNHDFTDESEINLSAIRSRRSTSHGVPNETNMGDELETFCYTPYIDDDISYTRKNNSESKRKMKQNSLEPNNISDSDSYTYEYEYVDEEENNISNENDNNDKIKKKVKKRKLKGMDISITPSPYELNVSNCADINEVSFENIQGQHHGNLDDVAENDENMPNPYGLPHMIHSLNDNVDDACDPYN